MTYSGQTGCGEIYKSWSENRDFRQTRILYMFGTRWGKEGSRRALGGGEIRVPYLVPYLMPPEKHKWHLSVRVSDMIGGHKSTRGRSGFIHPVRPLHNDIGRVENGVAWC